MKKKMFILFVVLLIVCCFAFTLAACGTKKDDQVGDKPSDGSTPVDTDKPDVTDPTNPDQTNPDPTDPDTNDPAQPISMVPRYHISFYTGEGATEVASISRKQGETIVAPEVPALARHTFDGWYTDYNTWNNRYEFSTMPGNNLVLYAKWTESVSGEILQDYEKELNSNSVSGHLYIHYLRFDNTPASYEGLNLWVWPKAYTGKSFEWNNSGSAIYTDSVGGAVCDIDLTQFYTGAGNDGDETLQFFTDGNYGVNYNDNTIKNPETYMDPEIGFLIVYKDSKDKGSHWTSDGGNQYFSIKEHVRENGSIHIFAVQDNVGSFAFNIADIGEITNPYENDDGTNVSTCNVDSSVDLAKVADKAVLTQTATGVGYQIMVASFADSDGDGYGDIKGIISKLDYIESLNVDVLWLTPIQESDSYHGYDIINYKAVDRKFGTLEDYKTLLRECHSRGIKVIMDLVLNHTSINNQWFQNSAKMIVDEKTGIDYRSFYHWKNHDTTALSSDWYPYSEYVYSYYAKFASSMPELNFDYQGTRDAIADVAKYWLGILDDGTGVDGFRIDAVKHIYMADEVDPAPGDIVIEDYDKAAEISYSSNVTKNLNFFCWLVSELKVYYPNCYIVGENFDGQAYNVAPYYKALDGMLDFYSYYELGKLGIYPTAADSLAGGNGSSDGSQPVGKNTNKLTGGEWDIEAILKANAGYGGDIIPSMFSSNHDIPRLINNVMRVVNGAEWSAGSITAANSEVGMRRALAVLSTMMTMPGISWIYYGDELGMSSNYESGETKTSAHIDRQYRQPFKWATDETDITAGYSISGDKTYYVRWDDYNKTLPGVQEQSADAESFLNQVKFWTDLKSSDEVLRYGTYAYKEAKWPGAPQKDLSLFSFTRTYNGVTYWVLTNFSENNYTNMSSLYGAGASKVAVTGDDIDVLPAGGTAVIKIAG